MSASSALGSSSVSISALPSTCAVTIATATSRLHLGHISATSRLHLGYISATSRQAELKKAGIETVALCGFLTNCCVESTMRTACEKGYNVITVTDCCATVSEEAARGH